MIPPIKLLPLFGYIIPWHLKNINHKIPRVAFRVAYVVQHIIFICVYIALRANKNTYKASNNQQCTCLL